MTPGDSAEVTSTAGPAVVDETGVRVMRGLRGAGGGDRTRSRRMTTQASVGISRPGGRSQLPVPDRAHDGQSGTR